MYKISFNNNWTCNGQAVTLPHDAQILEKRRADASDGGHGYFPGGVYTYEKTFTAPADWEGKKVLVEFEGVYKNSTVSLNGKRIGGHKYGYTTFTVEDARLWSDETPNLYTARVTCGSDVVEEKFGIRKIEWSSKGLFLNGKKMLLRGGCVHHDNGILGAATYDESEWRRVRILKEAGFNAIRSAHNPTSRAMLESSAMTHILYEGAPLHSRDRVTWSVGLWDENGNPGDVAESSFELGLLKKEDWQARWITGDYKPENPGGIPLRCCPIRAWR